MQLLGTLSRPTTRTLDGLYGVQEFLKDHRVVHVCRGEHHREQDTVSVRNKATLRARFSLIRRIGSGFVASLLVGMLAESSEARSQSIRSASPSRSKRTLCRHSHTPASCHSRRRRQQVTPDPQPISWGSISQEMPLLSTKMMPLRAARSSTRGLPHLWVWAALLATEVLLLPTVRHSLTAYSCSLYLPPCWPDSHQTLAQDIRVACHKLGLDRASN
jgi:hypothetical protein